MIDQSASQYFLALLSTCGFYIIKRKLHGRLEKRNFSFYVEKYFIRSRNIFQHSKRNFVSPRGHVISSLKDKGQPFLREGVGHTWVTFPTAPAHHSPQPIRFDQFLIFELEQHQVVFNFKGICITLGSNSNSKFVTKLVKLINLPNQNRKAHSTTPIDFTSNLVFYQNSKGCTTQKKLLRTFKLKETALI